MCIMEASAGFCPTLPSIKGSWLKLAGMGFPWEPEVTSVGHVGIRRHTGRTQYLKLVAAEADRALPSLRPNDGLACERLSSTSEPGETFDLTSVSCCRAGAEGRPRQTNTCWPFKLTHNLVSCFGVEDRLICAVVIMGSFFSQNVVHFNVLKENNPENWIYNYNRWTRDSTIITSNAFRKKVLPFCK